jgi:hypothetical protein
MDGKRGKERDINASSIYDPSHDYILPLAFFPLKFSDKPPTFLVCVSVSVWIFVSQRKPTSKTDRLGLLHCLAVATVQGWEVKRLVITLKHLHVNIKASLNTLKALAGNLEKSRRVSKFLNLSNEINTTPLFRPPSEYTKISKGQQVCPALCERPVRLKECTEVTGLVGRQTGQPSNHVIRAESNHWIALILACDSHRH